LTDNSLLSPENTALSKESRWATLLLFSAALFLMFWTLGRCGLWTSEGRWAEVTREMFLTRDFFHPTIGGKPYFDKPLLTYWFVALASVVTGTLNELSVRLPSAVAGLVTIWATLKIGTRLWSIQTGRIAAWILLTTYGFLFWARTGTAEMENLAAITLAIAWYWSRRERPNFITFQVFYLIVFVGALTKGLTAVVIPILATLPDIIQNKRWRTLLKPSHILALTLGLLLYVSPFFYASMTSSGYYNSSGLGLVFQENILRYFKAFDHKGPVYLYFYYVPLLLLPWAPLWIVAIVGTLKIWTSLDDKTKWVVKAGFLIFIFYTLSGSRRGYYILPILPLCALLMAVFVVHVRDGHADTLKRRGIGVQKNLLAIVLLLEFLMPLVLLILRSKMNIPFPSELYLASMFIAVSALLLVIIGHKSLEYSKLKSEINPMVISAIVMSVVILGGYFCWQQNILDDVRTERPFAFEVKAKTDDLPPENIGFFLKDDATFLFYLDREKPFRVLSDTAELRDFLASEKPRALVTQHRYVSTMLSEVSTDFEKEPDMKEETKSWDSESSRGEKWVAWLLGGQTAQEESYCLE
jgi:4-amino-4-deoxy-L-arabinose transferase-like glycosyltransferase